MVTMPYNLEGLRVDTLCAGRLWLQLCHFAYVNVAGTP